MVKAISRFITPVEGHYQLFGGFPESFYAAYREALPLATGYPQRRTLYNLYHILNHLNLFGGSYRAQAERMMAQLLAELR